VGSRGNRGEVGSLKKERGNNDESGGNTTTEEGKSRNSRGEEQVFATQTICEVHMGYLIRVHRPGKSRALTMFKGPVKT